MADNMFDKFFKMFGSEDEDDFDEVYDEANEEVEEEQGFGKSLFGRNKIVDISHNNRPKLVLTKPTKVEEGSEIVEHLKMRKSVVINMENMNRADAQRLIDYVSGAVFAVDGALQPVSTTKDIVVIAPKNVEIENEIREFLKRGSFNF